MLTNLVDKMENDKIIMILLGIIVIMLIAGLLMFTPYVFGEDSNITITSMDSLDT